MRTRKPKLKLKYSKEFVTQVFNLYNGGASYAEIAKQLNITKTRVCSFLYDKLYKHRYNLAVTPRKRIFGKMGIADLLRDETVIEIRRLAKKRIPYTTIARKFGISPNHAYFAARFRYSHLNTICPPAPAHRYSSKTIDNIIGV